MSYVGESVEVFDVSPADCPKCGGESFIDRYAFGAPSRGGDGTFTVWRHGPNDLEHLVVQCRVCRYERLMEVAHRV